MSDQIDGATAPVQVPSDAKRPRDIRTRTTKTYSVTDLSRARLRKRGVKSDATLSNENKVTRGILRANFALVRKNDASVRKAKDSANDRKPWPTTMNAHTFDVAVNGKRAK